MMPLENQLVCQELSMKMKELSFNQESLFYYEQEAVIGVGNGDGWIITGWEDKWTPKYKREITDIFSSKVYEGHIISAYTVAELGEMLPPEINNYVLDQIPPLINGKKFYWIAYRVGDKYLAEFNSNTEADARAKMLIYLRENNLI